MVELLTNGNYISNYVYVSRMSDNSGLQPLVQINFDEVIRVVTGRYMYDIQFSQYMNRYVVIWTNNSMISPNQ